MCGAGIVKGAPVTFVSVPPDPIVSTPIALPAAWSQVKSHLPSGSGATLSALVWPANGARPLSRHWRRC